MNCISEEEAKTKWCPMSRKLHRETADCIPCVGMSSVTSFNRGTTEGCKCLGSMCMTWVWNQYKVGQFGMPILLPKEEWVGRCGLVK